MNHQEHQAHQEWLVVVGDGRDRFRRLTGHPYHRDRRAEQLVVSSLQ